ncbi:hypothetical protein HYX09_03135 [Candidatus Woesearchaeota archaeon]|nr:hypothetical protein [Candidatus Woesearchaeota archaeon]
MGVWLGLKLPKYWWYVIVPIIILILLFISSKTFRRKSAKDGRGWIKFYTTLQKLKKEKISEILQFGFLLSFFIYIILLLKIDLIEVIPKNFDKSIYDTLGVLLISFFIIIYLYMHVLSQKNKWITPYLLSIAFIFIYDFSQWSTYTKMLVTAFILFLTLPDIYASWKKPNWWILWTIIIINIVFMIGLFFIDTITGQDKLDFTLNYCDNTSIKNQEMIIECNKDSLIVGYQISCGLNYSLKRVSSSLEIRYVNGSTERKNGTPMELIAPPNVKNLAFTISGIDNQNKTICLSSSHPYRFPTYEEYAHKRETFLAYFLGLLAIVLFSIPSLMANLKQIKGL